MVQKQLPNHLEARRAVHVWLLGSSIHLHDVVGEPHRVAVDGGELRHDKRTNRNHRQISPHDPQRRGKVRQKPPLFSETRICIVQSYQHVVTN